MLIRVNLDPVTVKKIEELINSGAYTDIHQFLSVAISNQIEEEASGVSYLDQKTRRVSKEFTIYYDASTMNKASLVSPSGKNWRNQLLGVKVEQSEVKPKSSDLIWYFYNRFFPIKVVLYQLAKIIVTQHNNWVELGDLQVQSFEFAQEISTKLKNFEIRAKIPRNKKLSTGLPASSMELISLRGMERRKKDDKLLRGRNRFMDQIVGRFVPKEKLFSGACFDLGLTGMKHKDELSYVTLTELGKQFIMLENPILDSDSLESAFSDKETQFIFNKIYSRFSLEKKIVNKVLLNLADRSLTSSQIDEIFASEKKGFLNEERIATMGRLSELQLVNWEIDERGKSIYSLNAKKSELIKDVLLKVKVK